MTRPLGCGVWPWRRIPCGVWAIRRRPCGGVRRRWPWPRSWPIPRVWRRPGTMPPSCITVAASASRPGAGRHPPVPGDGAGVSVLCGVGHLLAGLGAGHAGPGRGGHSTAPAGPGGLTGHGAAERAVALSGPARRGGGARRPGRRGAAPAGRGPDGVRGQADGATCSRRRIGSRASCCCARPPRMRPRPKPASSRPLPLPAASRPSPGSCAPP